MHGDGRGIDVERVLPHALHQLVARESLARVPCQEQEQVELALCELDFCAITQGASAARVDFQTVELKWWLALARRLDPSQQRVDSRHQLPGRERLHHVVIGPESQADDSVGFLCPGGQHDDRGSVVALPSHAAHHLKAVDIGKHQVEHDHVGLIALGMTKRVRTRRRHRMTVESRSRRPVGYTSYPQKCTPRCAETITSLRG